MVGVAQSEVALDYEGIWKEFLSSRDKRARQELISYYVPLAEGLAKHFCHRGSEEPLEDLVQVGLIGLIKAVDHFDPQKEVQFVTYATHQITGEIRHYLRDKANLIRHPRWLGFLSFQINSEAEKLAQKLGRHPSANEVADTLNITEEGVLEVLRLTDELSRPAVLEEGYSEKKFEAAQRKIRSQRLLSFQLPIEDKLVLFNAMEKLVMLERKAIYLFFYFDLTQGEIGEQLGLSQRTVSRVIQKGLGRLKEILVRDLW